MESVDRQLRTRKNHPSVFGLSGRTTPVRMLNSWPSSNTQAHAFLALIMHVCIAYEYCSRS